jgi:hypothetical protein
MSTVTPMQSAESHGTPGWVPSPLHRWTLEQYEAMVPGQQVPVVIDGIEFGQIAVADVLP